MTTCVLLLFCLSGVAGDGTVLVVKSSENSFFKATVDKLIEASGGNVDFIITSLDSLKQNLDQIQISDAVVTLGIEAAEFARQNIDNTPVIHSYLTEFQFRKLNKKTNQFAVLLEQPIGRYLSFIKSLLAVKKVGIITTPELTIDKAALISAQKKLAIQVDQRIFMAGENPVNIVRNLLEDNDVLLSLPAPAIYNRKYLKGILLASYRLNRPVISYSPAHVKSGALAAIYTSPENIGEQLSDFLRQVMNNTNFKAQAFYYAANFNIAINKRVEESLGLTLPDKEVLTRKLEKGGKN